MVPAQAPLPTDCRLPFHPASGSHISILISESLTGVRVAATRQNAGRFRNDCGCLPLGGGSGDVKPPAATGSAMVMVVCLSFSALRLSHPEAPKAGVMPNAASVNKIVANGSVRRVMVSGSILAYYHAHP